MHLSDKQLRQTCQGPALQSSCITLNKAKAITPNAPYWYFKLYMHLCQHTQNSTSSIVMNSRIWETYTGYKWCFKNNHKNEDLNQILSVRRDRKDDNFYRIIKLMGDSNFFHCCFILTCCLSLFYYQEAARPGRKGILHVELSWTVKALCKSAHLLLSYIEELERAGNFP